MAPVPAVKAVLQVYGVVQGVGFRPFAARLAREHGLSGTVRNVLGHVQIEAVGEAGDIDRFVRALEAQKPPGSHISRLIRQTEPLSPEEAPPEGFAIVQSGGGGEGAVMPTPDLSICPDCLRELFTPGDPRQGNPFISCTHCGPRFSIMRAIPYDRENTAMAPFPLCPLCGAQYRDPDDRRYHAQTVCCNACGPTLAYRHRGGGAAGGEAVAQAAAALLRGEIVAIKGIGGYHFASWPFDGRAVSDLRALKGRERKPFAVMFENLSSLQEHCEVSKVETELLKSPARPIVLLERKPSAICEGVYTTSTYLGAFLPYTPLQHLLLRKTGPLVMTSANVSSLPILKDDAEVLAFFQAHEQLGGILLHDRAILRRLDDSVTAVALGGAYMIRRARGYVPVALPLPDGGPPLIALGAQQKNTVCLYQGGYAYPSTEIGDLDSVEAMDVYQETVKDMQSLLRIKPELAVCDMHPGYASTQKAAELSIPVLPVQHHHAHIASVMAEHGLTEPVIGVAFDGTGYGPDGTVWGGEFLIATPETFVRAGHLKPVPLLGSDESVRQGWKSAACLLHDAGIAAPSGDSRLSLVHAALSHGVNTIRSSSMGRVFDAISAMLGICRESGYDGQGAIELENAAAGYLKKSGGADVSPFPFHLGEEDGKIVADLSPLVRELHALAQEGGKPEALAFRFHVTVSRLVETVCTALSARHGIRAVALSGGVFLNRLLVEDAVPRLRRAGLTVYRNRQVSPGDGGVSLGQAYIGLMSRRAKEGKAPCASLSPES